MSLRDLIRGTAVSTAATAIPAIPATDRASLTPSVARIASVSVALPASDGPRTLIAWDATDWRAFYDERAGILEYDGGLPRIQAEARAFEATVVEWMNRHKARSTPGRCDACGGDGVREPLLPFGTMDAGHAWLHGKCWRPWYEFRKTQAEEDLAAMGIRAATEAS